MSHGATSDHFLVSYHLAPEKRDQRLPAITSCQVSVESKEVSPHPPFLQSTQPQFFQLLLISLISWSLRHIYCSSLLTLHCVLTGGQANNLSSAVDFISNPHLLYSITFFFFFQMKFGWWISKETVNNSWAAENTYLSFILSPPNGNNKRGPASDLLEQENVGVRTELPGTFTQQISPFLTVSAPVCQDCWRLLGRRAVIWAASAEQTSCILLRD